MAVPSSSPGALAARREPRRAAVLGVLALGAAAALAAATRAAHGGELGGAERLARRAALPVAPRQPWPPGDELGRRHAKWLARGDAKCRATLWAADYARLHAAGKAEGPGKRGGAKFLVYTLPDTVVYGLGCRTTGAVSALAAAVATNRVLILDGEVFDLLSSPMVDFKDDELVERTRRALGYDKAWEMLPHEEQRVTRSKPSAEFSAAWLPQTFEDQVEDLLYGGSLDDVDVLISSGFGAWPNFSRAMAEDKRLRGRLHAVFGLEPPAGTPAPGPRDPLGMLQVPVKPYFFRELWGCANWFLLGDLAPALRRQAAQPFEDGGVACPRLIGIHIRMGDRAFYAGESAAKDSNKRKSESEAWMAKKWGKHMRTPDDVAGMFFREADAMREREGWDRGETCYFVASDTPGMAGQAAAALGPRGVLTTAGVPKHVAHDIDEQSKAKSVADWILLSLADGVVHGQSTFSESALERAFGAQAESKCRPPHKRVIPDASTWYCLQAGLPPSGHAVRQAEMFYKARPKAKRTPPAFSQRKLTW